MAGTSPLQAQGLTPTEQQIVQHARSRTDEAIALLEKSVNINSGTMTLTGVRAVGDLFAHELESIGFETRWIDMPDEMQRAGHLIAERGARNVPPGRQPLRLLLIGHLDTVFEGEGTSFERVSDTVARGAGTNDMKGGDVVAIEALRALHAAGELDNLQVILVFTGDEEDPGDPLSVARRDLVEAAQRSDIALGFESGEPEYAVVARRSSSDWVLEVTGKQAHSSGIFGESTGYGAIFETARILDGFRQELAAQAYLTFSPGIIVGGTDGNYDVMKLRGEASGKTNIVPRFVTVHGDLRALTQGQQDSARATMRSIVEQKNLPGTSARIRFNDGYPPMAPTAENHAILAVYDSVSRDLGYGPVAPHDPRRRGAADISFVAPYIHGIDGLGPWGRGGHTPDEDVNLPSLRTASERAAVLMYRLGRSPAPGR